MRTGERQGQSPAGTSDQILGEIRDYCRATQTAESTFGRLVVNDGKLVSRLRDGARITTGTLDKAAKAGDARARRSHEVNARAFHGAGSRPTAPTACAGRARRRAP